MPRKAAGSSRRFFFLNPLEWGIVILIVGVLSSISVPNFQASRRRSSERAALANLKTLRGAVEMFNLDYNTNLKTIDDKVLQRLASEGYMQSVPDARMLALMEQEGTKHGFMNDLAMASGDTGQVLPTSVGWVGTAAPPTPPPAAAWIEPEPAPAPAPEPVQVVEVLEAFVETASDPLSTFAVDVDTGAYTRARADLRAGRRPDPAAIRIEEFVNFFDYQDRAPDEEVFAFATDMVPSPLDPTRHLVRVGLRAREVSAEARKPVRLTFLVDVSGSMGGAKRLPLVQASLELLSEQLRDDDRIAIVVYGTNARAILPSTSAREQGTILRAIQGLRTEGATNAEAGLRLAYRLAAENFEPAATNRVLLCSDGLANLGRTTHDAILKQVDSDAARGIYLTTVGFGMGSYQDRFMERLADEGDGVYAYVDTLEEARRLFVDGLVGTLQTVAKDAKVQVAFDPARVARYRLLGYQNRAVADADFRNDAVDAGEVGAGHAASALYEVELVPGSAGPLGTARARALDLAAEEVREHEQLLRPEVSWKARLAATATRLAILLRSGSASGVDAAKLEADARALASELDQDQARELAELCRLAARFPRS